GPSSAGGASSACAGVQPVSTVAATTSQAKSRPVVCRALRRTPRRTPRRGPRGGTGPDRASAAALTARPSRAALKDVPRGRHHAPLVGIGQPPRHLAERDPRDVLRFVVRVVLDGQLSAESLQQVMVHHLVHPPVLTGEPVVDRRQVTQQLPSGPGPQPHLPDGGLLGGLRTL